MPLKIAVKVVAMARKVEEDLAQCDAPWATYPIPMQAQKKDKAGAGKAAAKRGPGRPPGSVQVKRRERNNIDQ